MSANISIAKSVKSGKYVHINDVEKRQDDFVCTCGSNLIPIKSEERKKDWHFRHNINTEIASCRSSALHNYCVQLINDNSEITIDKDLKIFYSVQGTEIWIDNLYRSDITINDNGKLIHIEVYVTHDLSTEKAAFYKSNKIHSLKVDMSSPELLTASPDVIKDHVLNQYHNKELIYWETSNESQSSNSKDNNILLLVFLAIVSFFGIRMLFNKKKY